MIRKNLGFSSQGVCPDADIVVDNPTHRQRRQAGERRETPGWVQSLREEYGFSYLLPLPDHTSWGMKFQQGLLQTVIPAGQARRPDLIFDSASRLEAAGIRVLGLSWYSCLIETRRPRPTGSGWPPEDSPNPQL